MTGMGAGMLCARIRGVASGKFLYPTLKSALSTSMKCSTDRAILLPLKTDPMAHFFEPPPGNASIIYRSHHRWRDHAWMKQRRGAPRLDQPLSIYEAHLGSWRRKPEARNSESGGRALSYRELADELVAYVVDMGFTHIELLPTLPSILSTAPGATSLSACTRPPNALAIQTISAI